MLGPYAAVLRLPGTRAFVGAGFTARMPISMIGLGIVLLVTDVTGSFGLAGLLTALFAVGAAVITPFFGRRADAAGQHRVLPWLAAVHAGSLVALVVAVHAAIPVPIMCLLAVLIGGSQPAIGAMVRARWAVLLTGTPGVRTAFALEGILDELIYVLGPPLATLVVVFVAPGAALLLAAALVAGGSLALSAQRSTEPPPGLLNVSREPLDVRGLVPIVLVMFGLGVLFGALEIAVVSFSDDLGQRAWAGALIAAYATGSMIAGIAVGVRPIPMRLTLQWPIQCAVLTATTLLLPWITSPVPLALVAFFAGLAVAPALITGFTLVELTVPAGRLTEALTWASSGIGLGLAGAAAVSGALVEASGTAAAFLAAAAGAGICLIVSAAAIRPLDRRTLG